MRREDEQLSFVLSMYFVPLSQDLSGSTLSANIIASME
jgi:hypothetical protein